MNSRWIILLAALPLVAGSAFAEEEATSEETTSSEATASEEVVTEGDVLLVEEVEGTETTRRPTREADFPVPDRGMSMESVRMKFGDPVTIHPAVGDPPITRWDYGKYSVFFEYDKVLHAVVTESE